jgi:type III pantothenate kinase
MLLTIDAGNTNIVFAVFDNKELIGKWRIVTDRGRTSDEYALIITRFLEMGGVSKDNITAVIIANVVPQAMFALRTMCEEYFSCKPLFVGEGNVHPGIGILLERKSEIGADRLVNAFAAFRRYGGNTIVVDFGTATTFDVVDASGNYAGGVISPGINLSMKALHVAAAKLPEVAVAMPARVIGTSTIEAMQSGIYWGYVGLVEGIIKRINSEAGNKMNVVATGGLASLFSGDGSSIEHLEPDLTIHGLREIYELNRV